MREPWRKGLSAIGAEKDDLAGNFVRCEVRCLVCADKDRRRVRQAPAEYPPKLIFQFHRLRHHLQSGNGRTEEMYEDNARLFPSENVPYSAAARSVTSHEAERPWSSRASIVWVPGAPRHSNASRAGAAPRNCLFANQ